jgi:hypothetical protein
MQVKIKDSETAVAETLGPSLAVAVTDAAPATEGGVAGCAGDRLSEVRFDFRLPPNEESLLLGTAIKAAGAKHAASAAVDHLPQCVVREPNVRLSDAAVVAKLNDGGVAGQPRLDDNPEQVKWVSHSIVRSTRPPSMALTAGL